MPEDGGLPAPYFVLCHVILKSKEEADRLAGIFTFDEAAKRLSEDWPKYTPLAPSATCFTRSAHGRSSSAEYAAPVGLLGLFTKMERVFGVSYPTIKSRLTRIANRLEFVETNPVPSKSEILERLQRGEITAEDAIREMESLQ